MEKLMVLYREEKEILKEIDKTIREKLRLIYRYLNNNNEISKTIFNIIVQKDNYINYNTVCSLIRTASKIIKDIKKMNNINNALQYSIIKLEKILNLITEENLTKENLTMLYRDLFIKKEKKVNERNLRFITNVIINIRTILK